MRTCVTAGSLCNILEQAYLCTAIMRSHWSCLYMILLCNAYVTAICNVSVRSTVLHAYLNPFVRMGTMSPEDTIRDHIFKYWHASYSASLLEFGYMNYGLMLSLFFTVCQNTQIKNKPVFTNWFTRKEIDSTRRCSDGLRPTSNLLEESQTFVKNP